MSDKEIGRLWDAIRTAVDYQKGAPKALVDLMVSEGSADVSQSLRSMTKPEELIWFLVLSDADIKLGNIHPWKNRLTAMTEILFFVRENAVWKPLYERQAFRQMETETFLYEIIESVKQNLPDRFKKLLIYGARQYGKSAFQAALGTEALKELRELVTEAGLERELPLSWQNPRIYFKLNNHNDREQVAYYHCAFPFAHIGWSASATEAGFGKEVYISSSSRESAGAPNKGDVVVIYQRIQKVSRVVTHVLQLLDDQAETVEEHFGERHPALAIMWQRWPFIRRCKILAVLKPTAFDGVVRSGRADLVARQDPTDCLRMDDVFEGVWYPQNGQLYRHYDGAEPTMEGLRKVFEHPSYDATDF